MCTALDNLMKEGEKRGIQIGRSKGIQEMLVILKEFGIDDTLIVQKLKEKFQLSDKEAKSYLDQN